MAIRLFHTANCAGKLRSCDVVAEQRADLRIVGSGKRILRGGDFDVVGNAGLKAPLRERDFLIGQRTSCRPSSTWCKGCLQFNLSVAHLLGYPIPFLGELFLCLLLCQLRALPLSTKSSAGEDGNAHTNEILVSGSGRAKRLPLLDPSNHRRSISATTAQRQPYAPIERP